MAASTPEYAMRTLLLSLLLPAALACAAPAIAQDHDHHAAPPAATTAPATPAQRWATDAPLRAGMAGIRTAVEALGHYEMGHMGPEQAAEQAAGIQAHVRDIIANCKLAPDADAALHLIIAPLMQHAAALQADPAKLEAIAPMREALAAYARQFDDPQFADAPADAAKADEPAGH
jgi:hypothetical protein